MIQVLFLVFSVMETEMSHVVEMRVKIPDRILTNEYFSKYFKDDFSGLLERTVGQKNLHCPTDDEAVDYWLPGAAGAGRHRFSRVLAQVPVGVVTRLQTRLRLWKKGRTP
jgi:hypothetical protein